MKTNSKISAYILRGSTASLLFSCVIVALCSAINLPEQPLKAPPPQDNAAFGANAYREPKLELRGSRRVSAGNRRRLLASPDLARHERRPQAIARRGDVSGGDRKEGRQIICATRRRWKITGNGRLLLNNCKPRWSAWPVTPSSRKSCGNYLKLLETIPLSSRSVWPDQY